jgi:hypothetical protein
MNPLNPVFDEHAAEYDRWFDDHPGTCAHQVRMLRKAVGTTGTGLEVGVGSGRFAGFSRSPAGKNQGPWLVMDLTRYPMSFESRPGHDVGIFHCPSIQQPVTDDKVR